MSGLGRLKRVPVTLRVISIIRLSNQSCSDSLGFQVGSPHLHPVSHFPVRGGMSRLAKGACLLSRWEREQLQKEVTRASVGTQLQWEYSGSEKSGAGETQRSSGSTTLELRWPLAGQECGMPEVRAWGTYLFGEALPGQCNLGSPPGSVLDISDAAFWPSAPGSSACLHNDN